MIRTTARTAVVAGTATALVNGASRHRLEPELDEAEDQCTVGAPASVATAGSHDPKIEQLEQLAALKDQGVLTADEFAAEKARLLG